MLPISKSSTAKQSLLLPKIGLLGLAIAIAGCNSNSTESKQDGPNTAESVSNANTSVTAKDSNPEVVAALEKNFKASGFDQTIISAIPTKMDGIYWVTSEGMPSFFSDESGQYVMQGQIIEIGQDKPIDISADLIAENAKTALANVDKDEMIIYPAKGETKAAVYVFTDADCPYCTKLHSEMDTINDLGIEVRYLAWPRSEGSVPKMESIWCSEDRAAAMNQAKAGQALLAPDCDSPVRDHMKLGMSLGVSGTPAIYTESGYQIGGYLPANQLAEAAVAY